MIVPRRLVVVPAWTLLCSSAFSLHPSCRHKKNNRRGSALHISRWKTQMMSASSSALPTSMLLSSEDDADGIGDDDVTRRLQKCTDLAVLLDANSRAVVMKLTQVARHHLLTRVLLPSSLQQEDNNGCKEEQQQLRIELDTEDVSLALLQDLLVEEKPSVRNEGRHTDADEMSSSRLTVHPQRWHTKPALHVLFWVLESWLQSGVLPTRAHESFCVPGVVECMPSSLQNNNTSVLQSYQKLREATTSRHSCDVGNCLDSLLRALGNRGILFLLGHRSTIGSHDHLSPPISVLLDSFQHPNRAHTASSLTVGGCAVSKHWHRSIHSVASSDVSFWPRPIGNEAQKNEAALRVVVAILSNVAWVNVHVVPASDGMQLPIVEIRHISGYGARWSANGTVFRGFIEPVPPLVTSTKKMSSHNAWNRHSKQLNCCSSEIVFSGCEKGVPAGPGLPCHV